MATTHVTSARKTKDGVRPICCSCGNDVEIGQSYDWFQANRFTRKLAWHSSCKAPRPSALEANEKRSTLMAAFETAYDEIQSLRTLSPEKLVEVTISNFNEIIEAVAEAFREVQEAYEEGASNIEDGFGHSTSASEQQTEWAEQCETAADGLDSPDWDTELEIAEDDEDTLADRIDALCEEAEGKLSDAESEIP